MPKILTFYDRQKSILENEKFVPLDAAGLDAVEFSEGRLAKADFSTPNPQSLI